MQPTDLSKHDGQGIPRGSLAHLLRAALTRHGQCATGNVGILRVFAQVVAKPGSGQIVVRPPKHPEMSGPKHHRGPSNNRGLEGPPLVLVLGLVSRDCRFEARSRLRAA